jgi:hypothetical protein
MALNDRGTPRNGAIRSDNNRLDGELFFHDKVIL